MVREIRYRPYPEGQLEAKGHGGDVCAFAGGWKAWERGFQTKGIAYVHRSSSPFCSQSIQVPLTRSLPVSLSCCTDC